MRRGRFAQVIAPRPVRGFFTYSVPPELDAQAGPGRRVVVPFGSRKLIGLVAARTEETDVETKDIAEVIDDAPVAPPDMMKLLLWVADYYFAPPGDVAALAIPRDDVRVKTVVELAADGPPATRSKTALAVYEALAARGGERSVELLAKDLGMTQTEVKKALAGTAVKKFTRQRQAGLKVRARGRAEDSVAVAMAPSGVELTAAQKKAVEAIGPAIGEGRFEATLIHGVTGSGKTEVYAALAGMALAEGKSVMALAPEIALCDLLARRFEKRLGVRVAVIHSALKPAERREMWRMAREGEARLLVGARSAVFAPMDNLGLVIVDEEHDASYKQEESPRYSGRDVAVKRAQLAGIPVVLGSATPSMESYYNCKTGKYRLVEMGSRIDGRPMPEVELCEPEPGSRVGSRLREAIGGCLEAGGQALVFLNRRGTARYIQCSQCGHVFECRNCSVSLVFHADSRKLECHTCGYAEAAPDKCAECGSDRLYEGGAGTKGIEREISEMFPGARVRRMDRDTTSRRTAGAEILSAVESKDVDILVGTQMITKGHDYPGITVVGALSADDTLYMPDFRSAERTFQQITQAAGRAGRGETPGRVIVQTLSGDHHSVLTAARHDFAEFYRREAEAREAAGYPPFARLARVRVESGSRDRGQALVDQLGRALDRIADSWPDVQALGPVEAIVFKAKNRYRWRFLFKGPGPGEVAGALRAFMAEAEKIAAGEGRGARIFADVDPVDVM